MGSLDFTFSPLLLAMERKVKGCWVFLGLLSFIPLSVYEKSFDAFVGSTASH